MHDVTSEQDVTVSWQVVRVSLTRCAKAWGFVLLLKITLARKKALEVQTRSQCP